MSGMYGALTVGALGVSNNIGGLTTSWHSGMLDGASALMLTGETAAGRYPAEAMDYFCRTIRAAETFLREERN